jgi:phosphopantetheinyl transferase
MLRHDFSSFPEPDYSGPQFNGFTVHFLLISDSVFSWRFQKNSAACESNIYKSSHLSEKEHYRTIRKKILAHYLSLSESDILIEKDEMGRPVIIRPITNLSFSTSYTRSCSVFVLSRAGPIGVDVEDINSEPNILNIAQRFFHRNEYEYLLKISEKNQVHTFYLLWTLKEAYLKAMGTGLAGLQNLPDLSHHVRKYQEVQSTPFSLGCGFQAHFLLSDSACLAVVFPEK